MWIFPVILVMCWMPPVANDGLLAKFVITYWNKTDIMNDTQTGHMMSKSFDGRYGETSKISSENGLVVHVRDIDNNTDGCKPAVNVPQDEPWIALIQRGSCSFQTKIFQATKLSNASAVVVYNNQDRIIKMTGITTDDEVAISVKKTDGEFIARLADGRYTGGVTYRVMSNISPPAKLIYVSSPKTWPDARTYCQGLGGDLVSVTSYQRQSEVEAVIASNKQGRYSHPHHWIGLHDHVTEGTFVWVNGSSVQFENWAPGEPYGYEEGEFRDCVLMQPDIQQYQWRDYPCNMLIRSICIV